jgi:hypothetical protein
MAQGYSGYNVLDNSFTIKDSPNLDAFSRLRISNPLTLFSSQFTYNLNPLLFEQITSGGGAIVHSTTNRCANISLTSASSGAKAYMQSFEYLPYQPSKSQLVFVTFNMKTYTVNTLKFAGLSDRTNGIEFQNTGVLNRFVIYSGTDNGNEIVNQDSWNLDKLDGSGTSGLVLDITKVQILIIDFQALYVGRVRVGFDMGGKIIYCHEFKHANAIINPYLQTANLPVRCGMEATGSVATASMNFICCAVVSEGGTEDVNIMAYSFQVDGSVTASNGARTHLMSLRPKTEFPASSGITNRIRVGYLDIELLVTSGNNPVHWELVLGQAITSPTWADVNTTYSSVEYGTGTISGSPSIVIDGGYVSASNQAKGVLNTSIFSRYPITLDSTGAVRALGTISLLVTGIGGTSPIAGSFKFREIR